MTDDGRVLRLLDEVLDGYPTMAPEGLLASVLDGIRTAPERDRQPWVGGWRRPIRGPMALARSKGWMLVTAAVVIAAVAVVQLGPLRGVSGPGAPTPSPSQTLASPSPSPSPASGPSASPISAFHGTVVSLEDVGRVGLVSGVAYTSRFFRPQVAFRLPAFGSKPEAGQVTDWCLGDGSDPPQAPTSTRTIVLAWKMGCVSDLRIIRPFAVDCGTANAHPDASTLAAAILDNPGMGAVRDLGSPRDPGVVPAGLFLSPTDGRVVEVSGSRDFDPGATDPDHCRLLPEPGSGDPVIEIRGDLSSLLILIDIDGEMVVLRAAGGGYDAPTGAAARDRGYGSAEAFTFMLTAIHDIEFNP